MDVLTTYIMPVFVSIVASWLAGFLWSRILFRLPSADGLSKATVSALQHTGDIGFACVIAWIMFRTGRDSILDGISIAVALWLVFVAGVAGHFFAFRSFPFRFFATASGGVLFTLLVIAVILGALIG